MRAVAVDDIISEMMGERCVNTGHISHPDNHISSMIHDHCAPADQAQVTLVPPPPAWYCDHDIYISSLPARNITLGCSLQLPTQIAAKNRQTCIIRRKIYLLLQFSLLRPITQMSETKIFSFQFPLTTGYNIYSRVCGFFPLLT